MADQIDPLRQKLQQAVQIGNQVPQPGTTPLERTTGPAYDLKYTPYQTTMANKAGLPPEELDALSQQAIQANPNSTTGYGNTMDQLLKQRLIQALQAQQPQR